MRLGDLHAGLGKCCMPGIRLENEVVKASVGIFDRVCIVRSL
jgi:hypothetical protein